MLLSEIIDLSIKEDLGSLKQIDKNLIKVIMGYGNRAKLIGSAGRNSDISTTVFKNAAQIKLFLKENNNIGVIMLIDGVQVAAIGGDNEGGCRGRSGNYKVSVLAKEFFKRMSHEDWKKFEERASSIFKNGNYGNIWTYDSNDVDGSYKFMTLLNSAAKKMQDVSISWLSITKDKERIKKKSDRYDAIDGMELKPKDREYKNYIKSLTGELKDRLDKFKNNNLSNYDDLAQLLQAIIDEGYFDKFSIYGHVYNFEKDRINLRALQGRNKWDEDFYVEYSLDSNTDKYMKSRIEIKNQIKDMQKSDGMDDEEIDKFADELNSQLPPRTLKIILGLDGGKIVPKEIQVISNY